MGNRWGKGREYTHTFFVVLHANVCCNLGTSAFPFRSFLEFMTFKLNFQQGLSS